ncbi:hypothetical protein GCM10027079_03500 [Sediminivirga luteola]
MKNSSPVPGTDRFRTVLRLAGGIGVVVLAVGAGVAAGWAAFAPPRVEMNLVDAPVYTVIEDEVGRSTTYTATAQWSGTPIAAGAAEGTVTSVDVPADGSVDAGDVIYTVGLRPVIVGEGAVPSFRDLSEDDEGPDVAQLQGVLAAAGYFRVAPDGEFGPLTVAAVKAWQKGLGIEADGIVRAGDIVYVPALPARMTVTDDIVPGAVLTPGVVTASVLAEAPEVELAIGDGATPPPLDTPVIIEAGPGTEWRGTVTEYRMDPELAQPEAAIVKGPDDTAVCGDTCDTVPVNGASYTARVQLVEARTGPVVPLSAIGTGPDGGSFVLMADESERAVEVLVVDGSRAVVNGVEAGDEVRLFATGPATETGSGEPAETPADDG